MKGVGISGVSGTGKLELAKAFAIETGNVLLPFRSEDLLEGTRGRFTTAGVIEEYKAALDHLESVYRIAPKRFVTNITPVDVMAELYSTFAWFNEPSETASKRVEELWVDACRICSVHLSVIMHIKPLNAGARQTHLGALGAGLIHTRLVNETFTESFTINRNMVDLDARMAALKTFVFQQYEKASPYKTPSSLKH